jgi:hypothetical protein
VGLRSTADAPGTATRRPRATLRRGLGLGLVVWFVGFVLSAMATPMVAGPIPIAEAPVVGPLLSYLGFHLWYVVSTGGFALAYGPGVVLAAIPVAVTLAGGTAAAAGSRGRGRGRRALAGASIAVGYAVATVAAFGVVVVLGGTGLSPLGLAAGVGPGTLLVLAVDGVVQPAVLGGIGGLLGA